MNYKTLLAAYNFIKSVIDTLEKDNLRETLIALNKDAFMNWMDKVTDALRDVIVCQPEISDTAQEIISALTAAYDMGHIDAKQHNVKRSVELFIDEALNTGDLDSLIDHINQSWLVAKEQIQSTGGYVQWGAVLVDKNAAAFIERVIR